MKVYALMPLATLAAGLAFVTIARADGNDDPSIPDLTCNSQPADAPNGWQFRTFLNEASLTEGRAEIYTVTRDTDGTPTYVLAQTLAATKSDDLGSADHMTDTWTAPDFKLVYDLKLDGPNPTSASASVTYTGAGQHLDLQLDCY